MPGVRIPRQTGQFTNAAAALSCLHGGDKAQRLESTQQPSTLVYNESTADSSQGDYDFMMRPSALLLLAACVDPATRATDTAPPDSPADTFTDTSLDTSSDTSADAVESVPGADEPAPGLCEIILDCDGPIEDEPKIGCDLTVTSHTGITQYSGRAGVDLRGRSSSVFPKPQYAAELWSTDGQDTSANLMDMGGESDWILNGAHIDRALFRNKLAYDSFQAAQPDGYAAESAHCTMTLDGDWVGIYFLTERVKRDDDRIDLAPDDSGQTFIVKLDDEDGVTPNTGGTGTWQLVYPRSDDISPAAEATVNAVLIGWQGAIAYDPASLAEHVDLESMIDFILLQEMTRNNDAYYLSVHLSRAPGERLRFIPWDSDLTLGQPSYNDNENPAGWVVYRPAFIANMASVPGFSDALEARWQVLRAGVWSDKALDTRMDAYREIMGETAYENFEVWPIADIEFGWSGVDYLYEVSSYDEEYDRVRAWLPQRLAWIDANIGSW